MSLIEILVDTPACSLCQRKGTLEHILICRPKALGGRPISLAARPGAQDHRRYHLQCHHQLPEVKTLTANHQLRRSQEQHPRQHHGFSKLHAPGRRQSTWVGDSSPLIASPRPPSDLTSFWRKRQRRTLSCWSLPGGPYGGGFRAGEGEI